MGIETFGRSENSSSNLARAELADFVQLDREEVELADGERLVDGRYGGGESNTAPSSSTCTRLTRDAQSDSRIASAS